MEKMMQDYATMQHNATSGIEKSGEGSPIPAVPRQEKKAEAVCRLTKLGVRKSAVNDFEKHNVIPFFVPNKAIKDFVSHDNAKLVHDFEEKFNTLVYAIVCCKTAFGLLESLLYVSDEKEEWAMDRNGIEDGYVMTWTENLDYPECSEFGEVALKANEDGLLFRVG